MPLFEELVDGRYTTDVLSECRKRRKRRSAMLKGGWKSCGSLRKLKWV